MTIQVTVVAMGFAAIALKLEHKEQKTSFYN